MGTWWNNEDYDCDGCVYTCRHICLLALDMMNMFFYVLLEVCRFLCETHVLYGHIWDPSNKALQDHEYVYTSPLGSDMFCRWVLAHTCLVIVRRTMHVSMLCWHVSFYTRSGCETMSNNAKEHVVLLSTRLCCILTCMFFTCIVEWNVEPDDECLGASQGISIVDECVSVVWLF